MAKRFLVSLAGLFLVAGLTLASDTAKSGKWSGWVTDDMCGAKGTNAGHASCAKQCVDMHGAKYALYNTADKQVYILDPQDKAAGHAGHEVTVEGTLDGKTIHVTSITMKPAS
jgi:hypothetical protein